MIFSCECCAVSGRGLFEGLWLVRRILTECRVTECDLETSVSGSGGLAHQGCRAIRKKLYGFIFILCLSFIWQLSQYLRLCHRNFSEQWFGNGELGNEANVVVCIVFRTRFLKEWRKLGRRSAEIWNWKIPKIPENARNATHRTETFCFRSHEGVVHYQQCYEVAVSLSVCLTHHHEAVQPVA